MIVCKRNKAYCHTCDVLAGDKPAMPCETTMLQQSALADDRQRTWCLLGDSCSGVMHM